ncbi:MAG: UvrD-helicase domain-containing protein [Bacteroidaceae bacterium]|nr:UvrD-helicase domain-containing protein [Bacteroidaceae bacterium]
MNLNELNPSQQEAVLYCDGPSLVIAGAGSGKTRVLTYKIAYLLEQGMLPWNILALTFTNKAANEMKQRIGKQVGEERARGLWMGTFHSIFARILRREAAAINFSSNFTIYDAADSKSLVKTIIKEMQLDEKTYKPGAVLGHISAAKNRLVSPSAYMRDPQLQKADQQSRIPATGEIYKRYVNRCMQADALDFDDILVYTYTLFANNPDILRRYEEHFQFVLVDEYQDTNFAQHAIVWQLTQHARRVCVVGDDAQSIYSFRGANIDNILTFQKLYEGARLFKLEQNYRSTQTIVEAANSLIRHNRGQIEKNIFSNKEKGQPIHVYSFFSDIEEANGVAHKLQNLNKYEHISWNEIAILYRTNAQSRTFEEAFRKMGIPYRIYGGLSFYQRKEIKDMIAYFRLAVNPNDEEALKRVINYPTRGIGQTTTQRVLDMASRENVSVWHVLSNPANYALGFNKGTLQKIELFVQLINKFTLNVNKLDAASLGIMIAKESGVEADIFRGREPEDISRQENLQELLDGMQQFVDERREEEGEGHDMMTHYLQEVSLISDLDESDDDSNEKLSLMTIHSAKGLEFRVVFIVGMEENLFPNQMASGSIREMEEERRLFYVALTRAEEQCYLTHAQNRYRYGKSEFCMPSPFLREIDSCYLDIQNSTSRESRFTSRVHPRLGLRASQSYTSQTSSTSFTSNQRASASFSSNESGTSRPSFDSLHTTTPAAQPSVASVATSSGTLVVGSKIEHTRFGRGEIIALAGSGIDAKATVQFEHVGTKQLLLRFAKFKIL